MPEFIENSFIAISLSEVIRKSVHRPEVQKMFEELGLLTRKEAAILLRISIQTKFAFLEKHLTTNCMKISMGLCQISLMN
jgi:hypothetical protein